jgi:hypothetical protein
MKKKARRLRKVSRRRTFKTFSPIKAWAIVNRARIVSVNQDHNLEIYANHGDATRALKDIKKLAWMKGAPKIVPARILIERSAKTTRDPHA